MSADEEERLLTAINAILAETMRIVVASYSADRSEWDNGLAGLRAILELMADRPADAYLSYVIARQMGPARVREVYEAGTGMLAMMMERLWAYSEAEVQPPRAARAALGGCEALMRREIAAGRSGQLPRLLPDIAYGATVPFLGQEEALRLSRRARELLRGTAWG